MKIPIRDPGERRKNDRVPADLKVEVVLRNGKTFTGTLRDMSIDGVRIELKEEGQLVDEEVKIRIFLPKGDEIHLTGKMVWEKRFNGCLSFGVSGIKVLEQDKEKFFEFLSDSFLSLFLSLVAGNGE